MKLDDGLFLGTAFTAGALGLSVGAYVGSEKAAYDFLLEWQPLIGGALAILAALITVRQMRVIDDEQARRNAEILRQMQSAESEQSIRHFDSMKVALRGEYLRVSRAHATTHAIREQAKAALNSAVRSWEKVEFEKKADITAEEYKKINEASQHSLFVVMMHQNTRVAEKISEVEDLFPAQAAFKSSYLTTTVNQIERRIEEIRRMNPQDKRERLSKVWKVDAVLRQFERQCNAEIELASDIDNLAAIYMKYALT